MNWNEYVKKHGAPQWPYPIEYGKETQVKVDVVVLGGGIAGCWAAISAARQGAKVILIEKGATQRSGSGGAGCDHWVNTPNPRSKVTAEQVVEWEVEASKGYTNLISRYIAARESYETFLELEKIGGKIRDTEDEFKDAPFRDEKTKFLFSYDYKNRLHFRIWGTTFKPALFNECNRLGVKVYDRIMATKLLTCDGKTGSRVIGATGLNTRTGELFVFKANAFINCMSRHQRNWSFSTEIRGIANFRPPQIVGDGHAMAWKAGAAFTMMEKSKATSFGSGNVFPPYGTGNAINTWVPCTLVDANGKEIPYVDRDGKILKKMEERTQPSSGQEFMGERTLCYNHKRPEIIPDLEERIKKGEFTLPIYADLTSMTEHERNVIWGVMVGEEGKTKVPIIKTYTESGFDPKKDLLQSYLFLGSDPMRANVRPQDRTSGEVGDAGGLVVDWNLKTNLEGLYAAGDALYAGNYHYHAAATGRYAGRKAAQYALAADVVGISRSQIDREKDRIYSLTVEGHDQIEWKELNSAICRVMQNYCGEYKNKELFKIGLLWLEDLKKNCAPFLCADNPHKLTRSLEVLNILTCSEMIIHACRERKASCQSLDFFRLDHAELDPPDWNKWITLKLENGKVRTGELPLTYGQPLCENYEKHCK
ncbi:MAG: FAD-dependent oxidoreductase [Desulfobacula sp.]|nr:FAD-dependent oxidoreductase [Desulfobacula sp.]